MTTVRHTSIFRHGKTGAALNENPLVVYHAVHYITASLLLVAGLDSAPATINALDRLVWGNALERNSQSARELKWANRGRWSFRSGGSDPAGEVPHQLNSTLENYEKKL